MNVLDHFSLSRRKILAAGFLGIVAESRSGRRAAANILYRGMVGAGLVRLDDGDAPRLADFSFNAGVMQLDDGTTVFYGSSLWSDPDRNVYLESTEITGFGPVDNGAA